MIGRKIVYKGVDYSDIENYQRIDLTALVVDAYTKIGTSSMPNGHAYNHSERVYVVQDAIGRLKDVEISKVIRVL